MHYFSRKKRLERRLRTLLIRRAGKLSEDNHLVAMFEPKGATITGYYADQHLKLTHELGALDEEIRLIREELK
jgi:hypothetical protein